jgi:flavin-binding protein dodecin
MSLAAPAAILGRTSTEGVSMTTVAQETKVKTSVAKVIELSAESTESFEDAIGQGIAKASETVDDIQAAWVKSQQVTVHEGKIAKYRVDLKVTFVVH